MTRPVYLIRENRTLYKFNDHKDYVLYLTVISKSEVDRSPQEFKAEFLGEYWDMTTYDTLVPLFPDNLTPWQPIAKELLEIHKTCFDCMGDGLND